MQDSNQNVITKGVSGTEPGPENNTNGAFDKYRQRRNCALTIIVLAVV